MKKTKDPHKTRAKSKTNCFYFVRLAVELLQENVLVTKIKHILNMTWRLKLHVQLLNKKIKDRVIWMSVLFVSLLNQFIQQQKKYGYWQSQTVLELILYMFTKVTLVVNNLCSISKQLHWASISDTRNLDTWVGYGRAGLTWENNSSKYTVVENTNEAASASSHPALTYLLSLLNSADEHLLEC